MAPAAFLRLINAPVSGRRPRPRPSLNVRAGVATMTLAKQGSLGRRWARRRCPRSFFPLAGGRCLGGAGQAGCPWPSSGASPSPSPVARFLGGRGPQDVRQAGLPWPSSGAPPLPSGAFSLRGRTLPHGRGPGRVPWAVLRCVALVLARRAICGRAWACGRSPSRVSLAVLRRGAAALGRFLLRGGGALP